MATKASCWSIALAGGDGMRLVDYVERRFGERRPKQYCSFLGGRSMFQHTLDRGAQVASRERTIAVVGSTHLRWAAPQIDGTGAMMIVQPENRDTAAGLLLPLAWIKRRDPDAVVAFLPSDHYIRPVNRFVEQIEAGLRVAAAWRDRIVLFGVPPETIEPEYGYVVPGESVVSHELRGLHVAAGFVEKPSPRVALEATRRNALWNTFVMTGHVGAFWDAARESVPAVVERFDRLVAAIDTPDEAAVLRATYVDMPAASFSKAVLERAAERCLLARLDGIEWSDWGSADRIEATLARRGPLAAGTRPDVTPIAPGAPVSAPGPA